jgi:hypothetical protein
MINSVQYIAAITQVASEISKIKLNRIELVKQSLRVSSCLAKEIKRIKQETLVEKHESKSNFNLFYAVTRTSPHREDYHSNFISYLLNPQDNYDGDSTKPGHDFGPLFLSTFMDLIYEKMGDRLNFIHEKDLKYVEVTRERFLNKDISIHYKKEWGIFIENKTPYGKEDDHEGQLKQYCEDYKGRFIEKWIGIYLTPEGKEPTHKNGVEKYLESKKLICLSYEDIIMWIQECSTNSELIKYPQIRSSLNQYVDVVNSKILQKMENREIKEVCKYLDENLEQAALIVSNMDSIRQVIEEYANQVRREFAEALSKKIVDGPLQIEGATLEDDLFCIKFKRLKLNLVNDNDEEGLYVAIYDMDDNIINIGLEDGWSEYLMLAEDIFDNEHFGMGIEYLIANKNNWDYSSAINHVKNILDKVQRKEQWFDDVSKKIRSTAEKLKFEAEEVSKEGYSFGFALKRQRDKEKRLFIGWKSEGLGIGTIRLNNTNWLGKKGSRKEEIIDENELLDFMNSWV